MRICQVMIGTGFGGAERSFVDAALALADRGHAVQAVCHRDFVKRDLLESHPGLRVTPVAVRNNWNPLALKSLQHAIGQFGPDIVHVHLARAANLAGPIARRMGVPVVAKLHNYANLKYYRSIDGFIATTEDQRRYLADHGITGDAVAVIPNFSRMPMIAVPRRQPVARSARPVQFITCGRLHTVKGFDILLKALRRLHDDGFRAQLIIGGDGPERDSLGKLASELGLSDDVEFAGWIDDTQRFLDRGDIYVLSSRTESFGISLLEAMARGLPIVSTRCQGPSHLLTDAQAWFAAPQNAADLARAMRESLEQHDERTRRGNEMLNLFRQTYSEELVVPRLVSFYEAMGAHDSGDAITDAAWPAQFTEATSLAEAERSQSRLLIHRDFVQRLRARGWTSCRAVLEATDVEVLRKTNGRDNCKVVIAGDDQSPSCRTGCVGYLKRHQPQSKQGLFKPSEGRAGWHEAEAIGLCERSGIATMRLLATGFDEQPGRPGESLHSASFSLTEAIGHESGFDTAVRWTTDGVFDLPVTAKLREEMIVAAARLVRRMHFAGLAHQDLFWQHFFFDRDADGRLQARVIDVQRMIRPKNSLVATYYWIKDLEQVRFSLQRMQFNAADVATWYQSYFATNKLSAWQKCLTGLVRLRGLRRSLRMRLKQRKAAQPASPQSTSVPLQDEQRRAA